MLSRRMKLGMATKNTKTHEKKKREHGLAEKATVASQFLCLFVFFVANNPDPTACAAQLAHAQPRPRPASKPKSPPSKPGTTKTPCRATRSSSSAAPPSASGKRPTPSPTSPSSTAASAARRSPTSTTSPTASSSNTSRASIVFYSGDNDIAAGRTPDRVFDDFQTFANSVHERLPEHADHLPGDQTQHRPLENLAANARGQRPRERAHTTERPPHLHRHRPTPPRPRRPTPKRTLPRRRPAHEPQRLRRGTNFSRRYLLLLTPGAGRGEGVLHKSTHTSRYARQLAS